MFTGLGANFLWVSPFSELAHLSQGLEQFS